MTSIVVVGGGLAGGKLVEALREQGYDGTLTLVGDEEHLPYERPPLSKDYLAGDAERTSFDVHDRDWYTDHAVDLVLGKAATAVDRDTKHVELVDGTRLPYDSLALATGSAARQLPVPGAGAHGVFTLRRVEDSERIRSAVGEGIQVAIIGGGWIGMEVAANARNAGADVTVIEAADLPLMAVLGPEVASAFHRLHLDHGVEFRLGAGVQEITVDHDAASGVRLSDGTHVAGEVVLVGIGAQPNLELAEKAGLEISNGVVVDEALRTSDPDIYAVGDIANHPHPLLNRRIRVEHWANALNQPAAAAASMLGEVTPYTELPYFFTDQYDLGMEYVGYADPAASTVVTRGDVPGREFVACWLDRDNHVTAGMHVNVWDTVDDLKALIVSGRPVDPDKLSNSRVALTEVYA